MIDKLKLPLLFDPEKLKADLRKISSAEWTKHFNNSIYEGEWSGIPLRGPKDAVHPVLLLNPNPGTKEFSFTSVYSRCNYFAEIINTMKCELKSIRLLKLDPGSIIKEHVDYFLAFEEGEARIHIPVQTNPDVYFYLNSERVIMNEGETWYLNFNLPHKIENKGTTGRVHLVMDCVVNDWLKIMFNSICR